MELSYKYKYNIGYLKLIYSLDNKKLGKLKKEIETP